MNKVRLTLVTELIIVVTAEDVVGLMKHLICLGIGHCAITRHVEVVRDKLLN